MQELNNEIDNYLDNVCSYIKNKKFHEEIKLELNDHIQDLVENYTSSGLTKEESTKKALLEMGSAEIVGIDLDNVHKANSDLMLLVFTASLIIFGLFTAYFIQSTVSVPGNIVKKSFIIVLTGIIISLGLTKIDFRCIKKFSIYLYAFSIILMLSTRTIAPVINGTKRFISVGPLSFDASEIGCLLLIISLAGIFDNYRWDSKKSLFKGLIISLTPPCTLYYSFTSMSSFILCLISVASIMIFSGCKIKYIFLSYFSLALGFIYYIFSNHYRINRILAFFNPANDPNGTGYVYSKILTLTKSAGMIGNHNSTTLSSLPNPHTDLVVTSVIYSFGWIGAIILFSIVVAFIIRIISIGIKIKDSYGKLLITGICTLFSFQFLFCILSSLSLFPALGFSMPFISYGGTGLLINILAVSLINNIYRNRNIKYNSTISQLNL